MSRGGNFSTVVNGRYMNIKDLDTVCDNLKYLFDSQEAANSKLQEELQKIKDEKWADTTLADMKNKLQRMSEDMYRGFPITKEQSDMVNDWKRNHDAQEHGNFEGYHGASGGGYTYAFYPTGIGTVGECICEVCQSRARRAAVKDNQFDNKAYENYMTEHSAVCTFADL